MPKGKKFGGRDWKPGQSGNPKGPTPMPPEVREIRKLTQVRFIELVNKFLYMNKDELSRAAQDPNTTTLDLIILKVIQQSILKGDQIRLSFILDRLIGRVPTPIAMNINQETLSYIEEFQGKSREEILVLIKQIVKDKGIV